MRRGLAGTQVYKRGTQSIPLSIDLWISYVSYLKSVMETGDMEENQKHVREVYEEAIKQAGLDMRSDNLYNDYLQWLLSQSDWFGAANLCDRSLSTPLYPHRDCYPQVSFLTKYVSPARTPCSVQRLGCTCATWSLRMCRCTLTPPSLTIWSCYVGASSGAVPR